LAVCAAALAIPLFAAGSAVAAMGGAIPLTSTLRPDLSTVTLVTSSEAQFCFDKQLNQANALVPSAFSIGGYNPFDSTTEFGSVPNSVVYDLSNTNCVDAVWTTTNPGDTNQYSFGSVGAAAVTGLSTANSNDADSTALTGSDTHNGTTGNTVAPDLTGVTTSATFNTVSYVFNKDIGNVPAFASFTIVDSGGNICTALSDTVSGNTVTATFPATGAACLPGPFLAGNAVNNAVRADVVAGTVTNATVGGESNGDFQEAVVPGTDGSTAKPDLVSAMLEPSGGAVDYNFDVPIGAATAASFGIDLANNEIAHGASATITNTATTGTVRVTFANGPSFNEYDVKGTVLGAGATALNGGATSTAGSVPIGDNAGAFARGFASGPDAVQTTFNTATGDVTVTFDQRVFTDDPPIASGFNLLNANGTPIVGGAGSTVTVVPAAAGPMQVVVHFTLSQPQMALAKALEICGTPGDAFLAGNQPPECAAATSGSVFTYDGAAPFPDEPNVQQILSPFAVSSQLVKRVTVWSPKRATRHHAKKHAKVRRHIRRTHRR